MEAVLRTPFYDVSQFGFVAGLEQAWSVIRSELLALKYEYFIPWPEKDIYDRGWKVFGLYEFGKKNQENCIRCPETTRLVESIPDMTTAGFSALSGGSRIKPHQGYTDEVLRYHLGLLVPEPQKCGLRVAAQTRRWEEGKSIIFDDTFRHEAWNTGEATRIVLLVDFRRPGLCCFNKS